MPRAKKIDPDSFVLLTGRANEPLAEKIGKILKHKVFNPISIFSDGEIRVRIPPNMRRRHVYIIQPTSGPVNDHLMELIFMIDAARRASASEIIAVIPYFGYARQDRKEMARVPISASAVASMLENAGAHRIVTLDIHAEQEEGFVRGPWDNVYASYSILPALKAKKLTKIVIASPDKGGVMRATAYARLLQSRDIVIVYKQRDININNKSETLLMIGNVKGRNVLLVDDMMDTGGTLLNAVNFIKSQGARSVRAVVTHGLFSGDALEKVNKSLIDELIVTDTVRLRDEVIKNKKVTVVSVAKLLAETIRRIESGESISSLIL